MINWILKVFHLCFSLLIWTAMQERSCDLELSRSALIASAIINTNTFQKTWKTSLKLNEILAYEYLEKWRMHNDIFYDLVNFRYLNLKTEYYQIQCIGSLNSFVDLTLEFFIAYHFYIFSCFFLFCFAFLIRPGTYFI